MLINAELFLKIKMQTGHFELNGSLLTSSGRQAWPPIPVCHSRTVLRNDFNKELGRVLQFCDLDPTAFNSYSFRTGPAILQQQRWGCLTAK